MKPTIVEWFFGLRDREPFLVPLWRTPAMMCIWAVAALWVVVQLTGCHDTRPALATAAVQREVGATAAATLRTHCTERYEAATTAAELDRLDRVCKPAARALRALRASHAATVALLDAYEAGRCATLASQASRECDLVGAVAGLVRAASEVAEAIEDVRAGGER